MMRRHTTISGSCWFGWAEAKDAIPHFDAAVSINGEEWSYRFNRARAYGLVNQWKEAAAEYRVAARLFPEDHATAFNLGLALLRVSRIIPKPSALSNMRPRWHPKKRDS